MGEKGVVGHRLHTRGIIAHGVAVAGEEVVELDVAVVPLVKRLETKKVGRRRRSGGGAFALPEKRRVVVGAALNRTLAHVKALGGGVVVDDGAEKFQVGVGQLTVGIFEGNQLV